jgi:hypothetical protein
MAPILGEVSYRLPGAVGRRTPLVSCADQSRLSRLSDAVFLAMPMSIRSVCCNQPRNT